MSEAEEFSRMTELSEVSDEEDYDCSYDIPEEASEQDRCQEEDAESWSDETSRNQDYNEVDPNAEQNVTKGKSKPYVILYTSTMFPSFFVRKTLKCLHPRPLYNLIYYQVSSAINA